MGAGYPLGEHDRTKLYRKARVLFLDNTCDKEYWDEWTKTQLLPMADGLVEALKCVALARGCGGLP